MIRDNITEMKMKRERRREREGGEKAKERNRVDTI